MPAQVPSGSHAPVLRVGLALLVAVLAISTAAVLFRRAEPVHPLVAAGTRLAFASALLSPLTVRAVWKGTLTWPLAQAGALAGLAYAVHFGAWVWSLGLLSVATSVTLVTATPVLLALWCTLTGQERPSRAQAVGIVVSGIGVVLLATQAGEGRDATTLWGAALALLGAAAMAVYLLGARRLGSFDVWAFSGVATGVGALCLLTAALTLGISPVPPRHAVPWLFLAAAIPQLIGHTSLTWALRHRTPVVVGIATVGEPIGATLLGWALLGEVPTTWGAIGCAVTLLGILTVVVGPRTPQSRQISST